MSPCATNHEAGTAACRRRIALLDCEDAAKWRGATEAAWRAALEQPGDVWDVYQAFDSHLPDPAVVHQYDLIVIGGSHYGANDDLPWVHELARALPQYVSAAPPRPRIIGCCFGHQILARALGGAVGGNPSGRFVLGVERLELHPEALARAKLAVASGLVAPLATTPTHPDAPLAAPSGVPTAQDAASAPLTPPVAAPHVMGPLAQPAAATRAGSGLPAAAQHTLRVLESHGDQVLQLPPSAELLASSATAQHEVWTYNGNVLAFQCHPEMACHLALDKILPALQAQGRLSAEEAATSRAQLEEDCTDAAAFLAMVRHFAHHGAAAATADSSGAPGRDEDLQQGRATTVVSAAASFPAPPSLTSFLGLAPSGSLSSCHSDHDRLPRIESGIEEASLSADAPGASAAQFAFPALSRMAGGSTASVPRPAMPMSAKDAAVLASAEKLTAELRAAFDAGLSRGLLEFDLLANLNGVAAAQYGEMADVATALATFSKDLAGRQAPVQAALATLPNVERQLDQLSGLVAGLEEASRQLARQVGVPERTSLWH